MANGATTAVYDEKFHSQVNSEFDSIKELVRQTEIEQITLDELRKAISQINTGKSADIYGLTIENVLYAGESALEFLLCALNIIFETGEIPDGLKAGLLTPIYKNKGERNNSKNYRGITVLPVVGNFKIIEAVLRNRVQPTIDGKQNVAQRGFTAKTSPLNAALIVEESIRECKDARDTAHFIFLDAKSAFDVVNHNHMMRRLYHTGVQDKHWILINDMHQNATSTIKWASEKSEPFNIRVGVRQGGILSSGLYKVHINPLLDRLQDSNLGIKIGSIYCASSACVDDLTVGCREVSEGQTMVSETQDFSSMERYELQPVKSVCLTAQPGNRSRSVHQPQFELNGQKLENVNVATHLGIKRGITTNRTGDENVSHNISRARRTAYSLFASGLHGHNGLDPQTTIHLIRIYILPVLLYGLEIILLNKSQLDRLELYQKKLLKQVLSVPVNTPDAAVYILTGLLPIEAQIHKKILIFFNNVCNQSRDSIEKRLAIRQTTVKILKSNSWFIDVKKLLWKYDLDDADVYLNDPPSKQEWKKLISKNLNCYWREYLVRQTKLYKTLRYINLEQYKPGVLHTLLQIEPTSVRDTNRIAAKLKMLCGAYTLQSTRSSCNQSAVNPTCQLCNIAEETLEHFILYCDTLDLVRKPIIQDISSELNQNHGVKFHELSEDTQLQIILDCTILIKKQGNWKSVERLSTVEFHNRRLIHSLIGSRYKLLKAIPKRQR